MKILTIILWMSLYGSVLALIIFSIRPFIKDKLSKTWQYYLWLLVLLKLVIPIYPELTIPNNSILSSVISEKNKDTKQDNKNQFEGVIQDSSEEQIPVGVSEPELNFNANEDPVIDASGELNANPQLSDSQNILKNPSYDYKKIFMDNIVAIWILGFSISLILKVFFYQSFKSKLKKDWTLVTNPEILQSFNEVCKVKKINRSVFLYQSTKIQTPILLGILKPSIILPKENYTDVELDILFSHECTHLKRLDIVYKWCMQIVLAMHWFNPFIYLVTKAIDEDCEISCDESVTQSKDLQYKKEYGELLLKIADSELHYRIPQVNTLHDHKIKLKDRLHQLMQSKSIKKSSRRLSMIFVCAMICISILMGCALNSKSPTIKTYDKSELNEIPKLELTEFNNTKSIITEDKRQNFADKYLIVPPGIQMRLDPWYINNRFMYGIASDQINGNTPLFFGLDSVNASIGIMEAEKHGPYFEYGKINEETGKYYYYDSEKKDVVEVNFDIDNYSVKDINIYTEAEKEQFYTRDEISLLMPIAVYENEVYFTREDAVTKKREIYKKNIESQKEEKIDLSDLFDDIEIYYLSSKISDRFLFIDKTEKNNKGSYVLYEYDVKSQEISKITEVDEKSLTINNYFNCTTKYTSIPIEDNKVLIWNAEDKKIDAILTNYGENEVDFDLDKGYLLQPEDSEETLYWINKLGHAYFKIYDVFNKEVSEVKFEKLKGLEILHMDKHYVYLCKKALIMDYDLPNTPIEERPDLYFRVKLEDLFNENKVSFTDEEFYHGLVVKVIPFDRDAFEGMEIGAFVGDMLYADDKEMIFVTGYALVFLDRETMKISMAISEETFQMPTFTAQGVHVPHTIAGKEGKKIYAILNYENISYELDRDTLKIKPYFIGDVDEAKNFAFEQSGEYFDVYADENKDILMKFRENQGWVGTSNWIKISDDEYAFLYADQGNTLQVAVYNAKENTIEASKVFK